MFGFFKKSAPSETDPLFPDDPDQAELIRLCRERFGNVTRPFVGSELDACQVTLTPDMHAEFAEVRDPMLRILTDQRKLRERGAIVWGRLAQANSMLFDSRNVETLPVNAIYSLDHYFDGRLVQLEQIARGLYSQKNTTPADRRLREFIRVITDERERIMRRELPPAYCGGRSVYFTTCFIQPSHLPGKCLTGSDFPMIVNFDETEAVMLLPSKFWPYGLVRQWT